MPSATLAKQIKLAFAIHDTKESLALALGFLTASVLFSKSLLSESKAFQLASEDPKSKTNQQSRQSRN